MKRKLNFVLVFLIFFAVASTTTALQRPRGKASSESSHQQNSQSSFVVQVLSTESITGHHVSIGLRGGGAPGIIATLFRTALRNPVLLLLMLSLSLLVVYEDRVLYAKNLQSVVNLCLAAYFFYLLVMWQKMQKEAKES